MGKKSKRRQQGTNSPPSTVCDEAGGLDSDTPDLPTPPEGWAVEHSQAKRAAKHDTTVANLLRVSRAYRIMREWDNLQDSTTKAIQSLGKDRGSTTEEDKIELLTYQKEATSQLSRNSNVKDPMFTSWFDSILAEDVPVDKGIFSQPTFNNLNCLQYAVMTGDVMLFERVVALGAAIDYPPRVLPASEDDGIGEAAPPDCSALLLGCAVLAQHGTVANNLPGIKTKKYKLVMKGVLECTIQLVKLGADCGTKLVIPATARGQAAEMWRAFGLDQKTAKELAGLSRKKQLIDAMDAVDDKDNFGRLAHCRCGSRLPWKDCHLGVLPVETLTMQDNEDTLLFRYSPLAPCYCKKGKKTYYKCCWESPTPRYQHDRTGELVGQKISSSAATEAVVESLKGMRATNGGAVDNNAPLVFANGISPTEIHPLTATKIRAGGVASLLELTEGSDKMRAMDPDVYSDILERIDSKFLWRDNHWALEKTVLLSDVKEWNEALDSYCDDKRLRGEERDLVIGLHKASPLAPCAYPSCNQIEKSVKQFDSCSRCRTVAYCSRDCQRVHWKTHKKGCIIR